MSFAVGALVKARGREWVVLPESSDDLLMVRPLGGTDEEVTGLYVPLETVVPATFDWPDPAHVGDFMSCRLLRDALRLGFRSSAGPFRSFANLGFEPRPYQLVPLLMGLKQETVRLLISDDVGIGKTVEAALVLRELLDRGEVTRFSVLCPPHLAEQWQAELAAKFHLEAELVLASTAARLERQCRLGETIFDRFPYTIVSMDFIKTDARRDEFARHAPELVIVDEAHACASGGQGRHQRFELVTRLAAKADRHLVLVTATPHSGNEEAFRSLLSFLDPQFQALPLDLSGDANRAHRERLAAHFVQRRRGDIRAYLDANTPFPDREELEQHYKLTPAYRKLFERALDYAREIVADESGGKFRQRVRWWSALALLRSLSSSPAAAAATLRARAANLDAETPEAADRIGRHAVFDQGDGDENAGFDAVPGADADPDEEEGNAARRRLREMAREADKLAGKDDAKLQGLVQHLKALLDDGFRPIVFCRFIPTADYVAEYLRGVLKGVEVVAVTGTLPPSEREVRVHQLGMAPRRVLVCTDCLSEGINLQTLFDAVIHYDLAWNPTRHEQREGRVDRYGQVSPKVRVLTYYGLDNQIDGIVLDVLLRKHKSIRSSLGISVPVPVDTNHVMEAVFEGMVLRGDKKAAKAAAPMAQMAALPGLEDFVRPQREALFAEWDLASDREKRSRTVFAQQAIKVDEVTRELAATREAIGSGVDVARFVGTALRELGARVDQEGDGVRLEADVAEVPAAAREAMGVASTLKARFALPVRDGELYLHRVHPLVEGLAAHVLDTSLDHLLGGVAARCGAIRTSGVTVLTTLLLVRMRFHIVSRKGGVERTLLAEDAALFAFKGLPQAPEWLSDDEAERLLGLVPEADVSPEQGADFVGRIVSGAEALAEHLAARAEARGRMLLDAHVRVREAAVMKGGRPRVEPQLPVDVLGVYIFLPRPRA